MKALSSSPAWRAPAGLHGGGAPAREAAAPSVTAGPPARGAARRDERAGRAPTGSVGRKAAVAISGVLLWGWTCLHLVGISSAYAGASVMEGYAGWLRRGAGVPLWGMRLALVGVFVLHVWLVLGLWARARRARPVGYAKSGAAAGLARGLRWASVLLLGGIVAHVLHFSFGVGLPGFDHRHVYANLVAAFQSWGLTLGYVAFAALFGVHLAHGLFAAPVSVGARWGERGRRVLGWTIAIGVGLGYAALPVAVRLGVLR